MMIMSKLKGLGGN